MEAEKNNNNGFAVETLEEKQPRELNVLKKDETVEGRILHEIKRFNLADAMIEEFRNKYGGLAIRPLPPADDKEAMKAYREEKELVREALQVLRTTRTGLEKKRKELKADYIEIGKGIDGEAVRLAKLVAPIEDPLKEKFEAAERAEEDRKKEAERLEQQKLQGRVKSLLDAGIHFDGDFYSIGQISVDVVTLKTLPDEKFTDLVAKVTEAKAAEEAAAMLKKEQEEEAKRKDEEERAKLKEEQEKLETEKLQLKKDQEELENQKAEARKVIINGRKIALEGLGLGWNSASQKYALVNPSGVVEVEIKEVTETAGEAWGEILQQVTALVADLKQREAARLDKIQKDLEENNRIEERFQRRKSEIQNLGFQYDGVVGRFLFQPPLIEIPLQIQEAFIRTLDEEKWHGMLLNWKAGIADMKDRSTVLQQEEFVRNENERMAKLSEQEAGAEYFAKLRALEAPVFTNPELKENMENFLRYLEGFADMFQKPRVKFPTLSYEQPEDY